MPNGDGIIVSKDRKAWGCIMRYLEEYYNSRDEDSRLLSQHGQVEYLTTIHLRKFWRSAREQEDTA